jgi:hypothetical protein
MGVWKKSQRAERGGRAGDELAAGEGVGGRWSHGRVLGEVWEKLTRED